MGGSLGPFCELEVLYLALSRLFRQSLEEVFSETGLPALRVLGNWASGIAFARTPVVPRLYKSRSPGRIGGSRRLALMSFSGTVDRFGSGISSPFRNAPTGPSQGDFRSRDDQHQTENRPDRESLAE